MSADTSEQVTVVRAAALVTWEHAIDAANRHLVALTPEDDTGRVRAAYAWLGV